MQKDIKNHWDYVHTDQSRSFSWISDFFCGIQNYEFFDICKKFLHETTNETIFEIGCAPGNFLIYFYKEYWYIPHGIDYSGQWVRKTQKNFMTQRIPGKIWQQDFFDDSFMDAYRDSYDVVFSLGFIEHYADPTVAIQRHFDLTKPGGIVIITIPNLNWLNKIFVPKDIQNLHNMDIMNKKALEKFFAPYEILDLQRMWWPLNVWLYFYKNSFLELLRLGVFALQRVIIDPILILCYRLGIKYNRYSSPQWIIICRKN
jgi:2-polyprenyl-3-methyl-5-hydroxy-6-metoxy-1,4-benzoquinol methylase